MPLPPPKPKPKVPARPPERTPLPEGLIEFDLNPLFLNEDEMNEWIKVNFEGRRCEVIGIQKVERLAVRVRAEFPRGSLVTIKRKEKR